MKPRICVSLPAEKVSDLSPKMRRAERRGADFIEVRLDYIETDGGDRANELKKTARLASVPLIATNRQYEQGGHRPQDEEKRVQALIEAAAAGFQYVDLELTTSRLKRTIQELKEHGAMPILSFHDSKGTPSQSKLEEIVRFQMNAGAEVCKLVPKANDLQDNIRCLTFAERFCKETKIVCFSMGEKGLLSRVCSPLFGAFFTFASLDSGLETAPGQISIADLKELYRKLGVDQ